MPLPPARRSPSTRLKYWLKANWQFVRQVKLALLMGIVAEMIFAGFANALDPELASSLYKIAIEIGVIMGLYCDPDEWYIP